MKNILLVVVDTLRPDHLGCYGYGRNTSPHLDELAARGSVLDSLWSASNFTAPAFTSLFTGLYPHQHGVFDFTQRATTSTLTAGMGAQGMRTAGVVTFRFFGNLLQDIWGPIEAVTDTRGFDFSKNLPFDVTDSSLAWLQEHGGGESPFCLFVHYDGPHTPFRLPEEHAGAFDSVDSERADPFVRRQLFPQAEQLDADRNKSSMYKFMKDVNWGRRKLEPDTLQWIVDKYDAAVRYNDLAVGRLLAGLGELGLRENTVVAVLSDHGEEFLEHGGFAHGGIHLYEEVVRTVGIVHDPEFPGGGMRIDRPCSQVDVLPTLLGLAGTLEFPAGSRHRDLVDLLRGGAAPAGPSARPVFCHGKSKLALREGRYKLILPRPNPSLGRVTRLKMWINMFRQGKLATEIYDLESDPAETRNLAGDRALRRRLEKTLARHLSDRRPPDFGPETASHQEKKRIEQEMKDLGYL